MASVLGRNEVPEREAWPDDGPAMSAIRRSYWRRRGEQVPFGEPDDDEYAELLAIAKGATRKEVTL